MMRATIAAFASMAILVGAADAIGPLAASATPDGFICIYIGGQICWSTPVTPPKPPPLPAPYPCPPIKFRPKLPKGPQP